MRGLDPREYFERIAVKKNIPFNMQIDVTERCNANCFFCLQGEHGNGSEDLSFQEIKNLLRELRSLGTFHVAFAGGEPFVRRDMIDILKYSRELGFEVSVVSNGHLINDELIDEISKLGLSRINISLHSVNHENYLRHFGIKNISLMHILGTINKLSKANCNVGVNITVTKYNIDEAPNIYAELVNQGINPDFINFNGIISGEIDISEFIPSKEQYERFFNHSFILKGYQLKNKGGSSYRCSAGITSAEILSNGEVSPCSMFRSTAGNVRKKSFKEIWNESHLFKMLRSLSNSSFIKCDNCDYNNSCQICIAQNMEDTGNPFVPSKRFCDITKIVTSKSMSI